MLQVTKKINGCDFTFTFDKQDLKENLVEALGIIKGYKCSCGSTKIYWTGYKTKEGYLYVKKVCADCKLESNLSQNQQTKEYFWGEWKEGFKPQVTNSKPHPAQTEPSQVEAVQSEPESLIDEPEKREEINIEDIPF